VLPPRILRRLLLAPLLLALTVVVIVTMPPLVLLAAAVSPWLPGRWRALRLLWFALVWLVLESAALFACLGLWIASGFGGRLRSEPYQDRHYAIMRWFLDVMFQVATSVFQLRVEVEEPERTPRELAARLAGPVIVMSRHAGPGDSFLLVHRLLADYHRRPRVVLKAMLQLDPGLDVMMNRLPHAFVSARHAGAGRVIKEIERLASDLGPTDALVIFPEGGNFTPRRRLRAIERLEQRQLREQAARARALEHLLAPHTGGALAAIAAAPSADVVFVAHRAGGPDHRGRHLAQPADGAGAQGPLVARARRRGAERPGRAGALALRLVGADRRLDLGEPAGAAAAPALQPPRRASALTSTPRMPGPMS